MALSERIAQMQVSPEFKQLVAGMEDEAKLLILDASSSMVESPESFAERGSGAFVGKDSVKIQRAAQLRLAVKLIQAQFDKYRIKTA